MSEALFWGDEVCMWESMMDSMWGGGGLTREVMNCSRFMRWIMFSFVAMVFTALRVWRIWGDLCSLLLRR